MKIGVDHSRARAGVGLSAYFQRGGALVALALVTLAMLLGSTGCRRDRRPNVVLIVVDTLRADRVTRDIAGQPLMPHIRGFAEHAWWYDQATSAAPMTMPSVATLLTGLYPDHAGVVTHARGVALDVGSPTMAEVMRAAGYATAAVVANPWLASPATRFNRGIETFETKRTLRTEEDRLDAAAVTDAAIRILEATDRPLFLWVHYIDTHMPYQPPTGDAAALGLRSATTSVVRDYVSGAVDRQTIYFAPPYSAEELEHTRLLYDAAARSVDREIGRLLDAVDRTLGRNTIVVLAADHGESLGEHGLYFAHDFTLYSELTHVPLIVRVPGARPARIHQPVSLVDVLPTVCEGAKIRCPDGLDGKRLPSAGGADNRLAYSIGAPYRDRYDRSPFVRVRGLKGRWAALRSGDRALVRIPTLAGIRYEAYDLATDPGEMRDVFDPQRDRALVDALDGWLASLAGVVSKPAPHASPKWRRDEIKDLRALGYLD